MQQYSVDQIKTCLLQATTASLREAQSQVAETSQKLQFALSEHTTTLAAATQTRKSLEDSLAEVHNALLDSFMQFVYPAPFAHQMYHCSVMF